MNASGFQDIDVVITTRELVRMIKQAGIDFKNLPETEADHILGDYTGAGVIFGSAGGVMEASVRTAYYLITGSNMPNMEMADIRLMEGIMETEMDIDGNKIRIAVANGLRNVATVLNKVKKAKNEGKEPPYHFIEVMACTGGCVGGGGQPYGVTDEIRKKRAKGLHYDDRTKKIQCSHDNPYIKKLYDEFLSRPLSEKSSKLLHTHYKPKLLYKK